MKRRRRKAGSTRGLGETASSVAAHGLPAPLEAQEPGARRGALVDRLRAWGASGECGLMVDLSGCLSAQERSTARHRLIAAAQRVGVPLARTYWAKGHRLVLKRAARSTSPVPPA